MRQVRKSHFRQQQISPLSSARILSESYEKIVRGAHSIANENFLSRVKLKIGVTGINKADCRPSWGTLLPATLDGEHAQSACYVTVKCNT